MWNTLSLKWVFRYLPLQSKQYGVLVVFVHAWFHESNRETASKWAQALSQNWTMSTEKSEKYTCITKAKAVVIVR